MTGAGASRAMTAPAFVAQCQRQGIRLTVVEGKLKASGNPPPKPEAFAAFLKARKEEIVAELIGLPKAGTSGSFEGVIGQNRPTEAHVGKSVSEGENGAKQRETAQSEADLAESRRKSQVDYFSPESLWLDELADRIADGIEQAKRFSGSVSFEGLTIDEPGRWLHLAAGRLARLVERCRELEGLAKPDALAFVLNSLQTEARKVEGVLAQVEAAFR